MKQSRYIFSILLVLSVTFTQGQNFNEKNFDYYATSSGLSHNSVNGIEQDSTGYIWIATSFGMNRFNGTRFVQFHSNNDSLSLASEDISGLSWLDNHRLGVITSGLHIIDTRNGCSRNVFIPYHDRQYQFKFNMVERAMGDESGNLYILTRSGFYHYDKNYHLVSRFDYYSEAEVPVTHFFFGRDLFQLDSKRLLIVSINGLYVYDKENRKIKKMTASDCPIMAGILDYPSSYYMLFQNKPGSFFILKSKSDSVIYINTNENRKVISRLPFIPDEFEFHWRTRLVRSSDTTFYLTGHTSGFFKLRFYPRSGELQLYPEKYFSSYLCTSLLNDRDGNLWVATNKGLFRENRHKSLVQTMVLPDQVVDSFPNIKVNDVYIAGNEVYVGTRMGGMFIYDRKTLQLKDRIFFKHNNLYANYVRAIAPATGSNLFLATGGPLLLFDRVTKKNKVVAPVQWDPNADWTSVLHTDRNGKIWVGSTHIYKYDPGTKSFTMIPDFQRLLSVPFAIEEDNSGNMWLAGHGLVRYNTKLDSFDIVLDSLPFIKMPDKQMNAVTIDPHNIVWFNSNNNGLAAYNTVTHTFRHLTRNNGLPDDNIASMIVIDNKLWMACFSGIACMDLTTSEITSFGKEDGFPDMPILKGSHFYYDKEMQQLYIGFSTALVRFNPHEILRRKSPAHSFIESIAINGEANRFLPPATVTTSWKHSEIRISIGTINFSDPNLQRFAYRIVKDSNTAWTSMGSQSSFNISSLSAGTHIIQVKTFALNNRWPEQIKEISIVVLPPIWKTDWFILVMTVIALVLLYLFINWRTSVARKKEMEKTHLQKLKADDYKNQFELEQISNYFSSSLADKKTEEEVLWDVAENLIGRMNYEDCMIYMWNEDKSKMVQKASYGPKGKPEFISAQVFDVLPGQGIVGHVIQTHQPLLVTDTRTDGRYRVDDVFRLSEVCVPIIHNNELLGVIDSENHQPNYFSERDIKILTTIATLIGNKLKQLESEQSLDAKRRELANINEQLAEARLSALQAQMNPHFVFNALNSIKRMILDADNEKASRYLSKFALMIRMTLNHSKEIFVTLDENIAYLKAYLDMEQLRFGDSFTYSIQTGENIDVAETTIPSMMIQPLVENAIWHGLMQSGDDKKIRIRFTEEHNKLTCVVEDNGIGIRQSEKLKEKLRPTHQSVGLENLQKRIKIMNEKYDMGCSLVITDLKEKGINGSGTRVVLQLNLINA